MNTSAPGKVSFEKVFGFWHRFTGFVDLMSRWFMGLARLDILCMLLQILIRHVLPFRSPWVEAVAVGV